MSAPEPVTSTPLPRRFGLLPATALNMTNMMGAGPFITIPLLMTALGGPQAMLGWLVALVIVICDGMVWSELGAAMPGSGGSFHYLREAFGRERFGRLMGFLFVWQFVLSGPLEIASGYIGFAAYARYIWSGLDRTGVVALIVFVGLINVALLYRRILGPTWVAGLAALLYAIDEAHAAPAAYIANRNALIATCFGVLCLLCFARARQERWRRQARHRRARRARRGRRRAPAGAPRRR